MQSKRDPSFENQANAKKVADESSDTMIKTNLELWNDYLSSRNFNNIWMCYLLRKEPNQPRLFHD